MATVTFVQDTFVVACYKISMISRGAIVVVLVFIVQGTIIAQHNRIARVYAFVNAWHKYHNFNGTVLVSENGRVVYSDLSASRTYAHGES